MGPDPNTPSLHHSNTPTDVSLTKKKLAFLRSARTAHLATSDKSGQPHVIPICFVYDGKCFYSPIDEKPKRTVPSKLKRLKNIRENPQDCPGHRPLRRRLAQARLRFGIRQGTDFTKRRETSKRGSAVAQEISSVSIHGHRCAADDRDYGESDRQLGSVMNGSGLDW